MVTKNSTTITLTGTEQTVQFDRNYNYFWVQNLGDSDVLISVDNGIVDGADGVITVPAGGSCGSMHGYPADKLYLIGSGKVQVMGTGSAFNPFKAVRKGGDEQIVIPDIYNHGDIVGLNGDVFNIDRNICDIYQFVLTKTQSSKSMSLSDTRLTINNYGNQVWYIPMKIYTKGYKYLCVEAEVVNGATGGYNTSMFGVLKSFSNPAYLRPDSPSVDSKSCRYLFTNNTSQYNFARQIVKINIEKLDYINITAHCCDCQLNIYSIFLSND